MGRLRDQIIRCMVGACDETCKYYYNDTCSNLELLKEVEEKLKLWQHYEDLEEQGLLAVRKQGRWIPNKQMIRTPTAENYHCSECTQTGKTTAYCPNCGAKMNLKELKE